MKNKVMIIIGKILLYFFILLYLIIIITYSAKYSTIIYKNSQELTYLNDNWEVNFKDNEYKDVNINSLKIDNKNNNEIIYSKIMPEYKFDNATLYFKTYQMNVKVFINSELIYDSDKHHKNKNTGNIINLIKLNDNIGGQELKIITKTPYNEYKSRVLNEIIIGDKFDIFILFIERNIFNLICAMMCLFVGVVVLLLSFFSSTVKKEFAKMRFLGLFFILIAIWISFITGFASIFIKEFMIIGIITSLTIELAYMSFYVFIDSCLNKNILKVIIKHIVIFYLILQILLSLFGYVDFFISGKIFQIICIILLFPIIYLMIKDVKIAKSFRKQLLTISLIFFIITLFFFIIDILFSTGLGWRCALFGIIFYIIAVVFSALRYFIAAHQQNIKNSVISNMAYFDYLTKLPNRNAYEKKLDEYSQNVLKHKNISIVIYDLNNLKKINDKYGHLVGDKLLNEAGILLNEVGKIYGQTYRIGGDEYALLSTKMNFEDYKNLVKLINKNVGFYKIENESDDIIVDTSFGFATFDPDIDRNLHDTMKRADDLMYIEKKRQKENIKHFNSTKKTDKI